MFYGSKSLPKEERPPIPFTPELEDGKWRAGMNASDYASVKQICGLDARCLASAVTVHLRSACSACLPVSVAQVSVPLVLLAVYGEIEFNTGHWAVFENAIDMAHIHYLHADSFGNSEKPKVMDMQSKRDTWETSCNFRCAAHHIPPAYPTPLRVESCVYSVAVL